MPKANRAAEEPEKFGQRVSTESATSQVSRPDSSRATRRFRERSHETQHESSIRANEDRESRLRLSARSMEEICGADAADKNRSVATDESFLRNARRIRAPQLHRKSRAEKQFHP